jgi:hypothetical protein
LENGKVISVWIDEDDKWKYWGTNEQDYDIDEVNGKRIDFKQRFIDPLDIVDGLQME